MQMAGHDDFRSRTFEIPENRGGADRRRRRRPLKAAAGLAVIAIVIGAATLVLHTFPRSVNVFVVNGADSTLFVRINGAQWRVPPLDHVKVEVPRGDVTVQRLDYYGDDGPFETVAVETNVIAQLFGGHTIVINPDRAAVLLWEREGYYRNSAAADTEYDYEFSTGQLLYEFEDIDYAFVPSPDEINMISDVQTRDSLSIMEDWTAQELHDLVVREHSPAVARSFIDYRLVAYPDDEEALGVLEGLISHEEMIEHLKPALARQPLLVSCHLWYQAARRGLDPGCDLPGEYRVLLDQDPEDPARKYLYASTLENTPERESLLLAASAHPYAPRRVRHRLVIGYISTQRFEEALEHAVWLRNEVPKDTHYLSHQYELLVALGRFGEALEVAQRIAGLEEEDGYAIDRIMAMRLKLGQSTAARVAASQFSDRARMNDRSEGAYWRDWYAAAHLYLTGSGNDAGNKWMQMDEPGPRFVGAATLGDAEALAKAVGELESEDDLYYQLVVANVAIQQGAEDIAMEWIEKVAESYADGGKVSRAIASWLRSGRTSTETLDAAEVCDSWTRVYDKRLLLTLLGQLDPANREQYFDYARKLNTDPGFPYLLINDITGEAR